MGDITASSVNALSSQLEDSTACEPGDSSFSAIASAHTNANVSFVDIFGADTNTVTVPTPDVTNDSMGERSDVVGTCRGVSNSAPLSKRLTFSDRVAHESRKLRQRSPITHIEDPGHVTPPVHGSGRTSASHALTSDDDDFLPYTAWVGKHAPRMGYMSGVVPPSSINRNSPSVGHSQLPMQSDEHVMEWFRDRFNSIEAAYSDRLVAIDMLARREVRIEEITEPLPPPPPTTSGTERELRQLKEENDRLRTLENEEAQRKQELSDAMARVDELENTLAVERKHNEENLKDKMVLHQRITNYAEEVKNLNESMDIIKTMHKSELEEQEKHKAELLSKIAQLEKDVTHFNDNLFSCYKVIETQKTEQAFLKKQNCALNDELKRVKLDLRRLYEANSNLKSQNMSLIEINNRIRTKTLFKTDTTDTCSTRGSCSSKASCISRDEFPFFHVFNDTPSANLSSDYGDHRRDTSYTSGITDQHNEPLQCSTTVGTISSMTKRVITDDMSMGSLYDHGKDIGGRIEYPVTGRSEEHHELPAVLEHDSNMLNGSYHSRDQCGNTTNNSGSVLCGKGYCSTKNTCIVDHSTIYSADNSTPNYVEALTIRDLSSDALGGEPGTGLKNKSWLIEKVSRVSNRDSLDYLKEKIKLITGQDCKNTGFA